MMKIIAIGAAALAVLTAAPALAQSSGSGNIGGGIGVGVGGFTNGGISTDSLSSNSTSGISGSINNELSASSGSGFGGTMNINSLPGGTSYAVVGGVGDAGTSITSSVSPSGVGSITSNSYNGGVYGGLTHGNAALSMQVMNFGESAGDYKFTANFNASNTTNVNAASIDWNAAGAVGLVGFGFGSLGWTVE
ncbi:MAG: hypothetical protein IH998_13315 [Proteobacteria bacterium]|jgi:hypothetical protein|nr:hypothetical protein [Pseudomonadota bacterium]